jgi:mannose-1-phosphate guanylyltransferase
MNALLLAAGLGSRLRPYTDSWPKCLMPINNIPLLEYWIFDMVSIGIDKIFINLHYHAEEVLYFIENNKYKESIVTFNEKNLLGTAGTIKALSNELMDEPSIIIHADNFCVCDMQSFINSHLHKKDFIDITMMTFITNNPESCGIVKIDDQNIIHEFYEKTNRNVGNLANAAIYIVEPSIIKWISKKKEVFDFSLDVIPNFIGKIATWENTDKLIDIGTPKKLKSCQNQIHKLKSSEQNEDWLNYFYSKTLYKSLKN